MSRELPRVAPAAASPLAPSPSPGRRLRFHRVGGLDQVGLESSVGFTMSHDSRPAPGMVPTDTALALTLDVLL